MDEWTRFFELVGSHVDPTLQPFLDHLQETGRPPPRVRMVAVDGRVRPVILLGPNVERQAKVARKSILELLERQHFDALLRGLEQAAFDLSRQIDERVETLIESFDGESDVLGDLLYRLELDGLHARITAGVAIELGRVEMVVFERWRGTLNHYSLAWRYAHESYRDLARAFAFDEQDAELRRLRAFIPRGDAASESERRIAYARVQAELDRWRAGRGYDPRWFANAPTWF